jgi:hypothetical protein
MTAPESVSTYGAVRLQIDAIERRLVGFEDLDDKRLFPAALVRQMICYIRWLESGEDEL